MSISAETSIGSQLSLIESYGALREEIEASDSRFFHLTIQIQDGTILDSNSPKYVVKASSNSLLVFTEELAQNGHTSIESWERYHSDYIGSRNLTSRDSYQFFSFKSNEFVEMDIYALTDQFELFNSSEVSSLISEIHRDIRINVINYEINDGISSITYYFQKRKYKADGTYEVLESGEPVYEDEVNSRALDYLEDEDGKKFIVAYSNTPLEQE